MSVIRSSYSKRGPTFTNKVIAIFLGKGENAFSPHMKSFFFLKKTDTHTYTKLLYPIIMKYFLFSLFSFSLCFAFVLVFIGGINSMCQTRLFQFNDNIALPTKWHLHYKICHQKTRSLSLCFVKCYRTFKHIYRLFLG